VNGVSLNDETVCQVLNDVGEWLELLLDSYEFPVKREVVAFQSISSCNQGLDLITPIHKLLA
jgi:hypothetical protein